MYVCMHACMCMCVCVCVFFLYICMHAYIHTHTHTQLCACVCHEHDAPCVQRDHAAHRLCDVANVGRVGEEARGMMHGTEQLRRSDRARDLQKQTAATLTTLYGKIKVCICPVLYSCVCPPSP